MDKEPTAEIGCWQDVDLAVEVWRCLWRHGVQPPDGADRPKGSHAGMRMSELRRALHDRAELYWVTDDRLADQLDQCRSAGLLAGGGDVAAVACPAVSLRVWLETRFGGLLADEDVRYAAASNVRARNGIQEGAQFVRAFRDFAAVIRECFGAETGKPVRAEAIRMQLLPRGDTETEVEDEQRKGLFYGLIEAAMLFGALRPAADAPSMLELCGEGLDADFLLHSLFGLRTGIAGFDELFEGGLRLADGFAKAPDAAKGGGRVIVVRGRFGTGKSTLALLLGAEIARKGGFVWYYSIEESVRQCCQTLETLFVDERRDLFQIVEKPGDVGGLLWSRRSMRGKNPHWRAEHGVFAFYAGGAVTYESLMNPLDIACRTLTEHKEPLTLMVVDPLNAVLRGAEDESTTTARARLRANAAEILMAARMNGANVLLACEETTETEADIQFMENIADTVIHLTVESRKDCRQRFLEITKSRYQKETGGKHAFNIQSGPSIQIFPSSSSLAMRHGGRDPSVRRPFDDSFGLKGLDKVLGEEATFRQGDAFAVTGPPESARRILALSFLLHGLATSEPSDPSPDRAEVLLVTTWDDERSIRDTLGRLRKHIAPPNLTDDTLNECVRVCILPRGYVQPGYVFQRLRAAFAEAELNNRVIRRTVLDDVAYFELTCPFIREDETFGTALLGFLAQQRSTALFVCDDPAGVRVGQLQTSVVDGAQTVIRLSTDPCGGVTRTGLRVTRTRTMLHSRGLFELVYDQEGLRVEAGTGCEGQEAVVQSANDDRA